MELMVVIVIITILTAMIVPEMRGTLEDALLRSSARQLAGACEVAYSRAVAAGQVHRLLFNQATGTFHVERQGGRGPQAESPATTDVPGASGVIDRRITVALRHQDEATATAGIDGSRTPATEPEGVSFYADGTAQAAEFVLRDRTGFRLALHINPVTSRISIRTPDQP